MLFHDQLKTVPLCVALVLVCFEMVATIDVPEFFPDINGDLTQVTWAHAVNSNASLQAAVDSDVMMLEADVSLGTLIGSTSLDQIPIMAHPPANTSDLSLEQFLARAIDVNTKGIKLDFKSTSVVDKSLEILKNRTSQLTFPVWLNADILRGPVLSTGTPVDADAFLQACVNAFPGSTLSVGWTTTWGPLFVSGSYSAEHVQKMIDTLKTNNVTQSVTFPVRAGIAAHSADSLTHLVTSVVNSTLTVWGSESDRVDFESLADVILGVGTEKVYIDLPEKVRDELDQWLNQP